MSESAAAANAEDPVKKLAAEKKLTGARDGFIAFALEYANSDKNLEEARKKKQTADDNVKSARKAVKEATTELINAAKALKTKIGEPALTSAAPQSLPPSHTRPFVALPLVIELDSARAASDFLEQRRIETELGGRALVTDYRFDDPARFTLPTFDPNGRQIANDGADLRGHAGGIF